MTARTARGPVVPALRAVRAVVFDTDGVVTDSARVHAAAWKAAFDAYLEGLPGSPQRPFDEVDDYLRHVDGRSRRDGAAGFLASRGLPTEAPVVEALSADKDRRFTERLREQGVDAFPGTVRLLRALRDAGVPLAAASASRHARELLERAGVLDLFAALVDGVEAARLDLPGKPDPALFLEAARRLGEPPGRCAVVEDALAGVEAGRRGGFALVVGVDRASTPATATALARHGADIVVRDLAELLEDTGPLSNAVAPTSPAPDRPTGPRRPAGGEGPSAEHGGEPRGPATAGRAGPRAPGPPSRAGGGGVGHAGGWGGAVASATRRPAGGAFRARGRGGQGWWSG